MNDSPAGLAAWIVEKFRTWSDSGGDVEKRFTRVQVPFACAVFPFEMFAIAPRQRVEASYNLVQYTVMPRGGHFAAMEEPQPLVEDVRKFFRGLR